MSARTERTSRAVLDGAVRIRRRGDRRLDSERGSRHHDPSATVPSLPAPHRGDGEDTGRWQRRATGGRPSTRSPPVPPPPRVVDRTRGAGAPGRAQKPPGQMLSVTCTDERLRAALLQRIGCCANPTLSGRAVEPPHHSRGSPGAGRGGATSSIVPSSWPAWPVTCFICSPDTILDPVQLHDHQRFILTAEGR